ncbi:MAG: histidinol-phosphate transaminase [Nitrospira sp.]|nr:histidinol-phosphate transaminase [Nitrospira sp.]MCA9476810.1 histidinol-phosphate transaminase [Nitrospira sp.]MCA9480126.1 histidinol-phosphate transaminase [Nitrospira sp.]MDR4487222.1 histidinol-phosphate transaminase [Nitrospirales bacterium]
MPLRVHPVIASLTPYSPGKPLSELERELGVSHAIKLASNENPWGPSPKALQVLEGASSSLHRYPDGGAHYLRQDLADRLKVAPDQVLVGNGSDEIISLLVKAFLSPGEEAVMADLTFVMYRLAVLGGHAVPVEVPLVNWTHDLDAMVKAVTDRTRLLFICNPNNPTGTMVTAQALDRALSQLPDHVVVVLDEAYYEYVRDPDYPDSLRYVREGRPCVVLRTFSKIFGLAGLRVGYGITTPEVSGYVNRVRPPFNVNSLAQEAARAALSDDEHVAKSRGMNEAEMTFLEEGLKNLGLSCIPSQANFLYFDVGMDGKRVYDALLKEGVIVRHIRGSMVRVTIGQPTENHRFLDALKMVLAVLTSVQ